MCEVMGVAVVGEVDSDHGIRVYKVKTKRRQIASLCHDEIGEIIERIRSRAGVPCLTVPIVAIRRALVALAEARETVDDSDRYIRYNDIVAETMRIMETDSKGGIECSNTP